MRRQAEFRDVRPRAKTDPDLMLMLCFLIVLSNPFSDLAGGSTDNRIGAGIVIRLPAEDCNPEGALFQFGRVAIERLLNYVPQKVRIPFAVLEEGIGQHPLQLLAYCRPLGLLTRRCS